MDKIYTRLGDEGYSSVLGGKRIRKNDNTFQCLGGLDELNALLGLVLSFVKDIKIRGKINKVQREIFGISSEIASFNFGKDIKFIIVNEASILGLEKDIDTWQDSLPTLHNFIIPGGNTSGALLHLARSVCRRSERSLVSLDSDMPLRKELLKYMNRLSDWLFVLARVVNKGKEDIWKGNK